MTANKRVTVVECCRHLGVDEGQFRTHLQSGVLPFKRARGQILIKISDLDAYIATRVDRPAGVTDDD
jgi:excisionase family DNA binding protein